MGQKTVTVHIMWLPSVPLSPVNLLAVFSNNWEVKSVSLSFCLSDSDYSLLTGVGSLSGRQANVSIISMDLLWEFDTQPPSFHQSPIFHPEALLSLSLSLSYRTLSPTANLPGILPLSPTWSTRLCPVEVCHCPVIKTRTFLFSPSCLCAMSSRISDKCSQCFNCSYGKDCY